MTQWKQRVRPSEIPDQFRMVLKDSLTKSDMLEAVKYRPLRALRRFVKQMAEIFHLVVHRECRDIGDAKFFAAVGTIGISACIDGAGIDRVGTMWAVDFHDREQLV